MPTFSEIFKLQEKSSNQLFDVVRRYYTVVYFLYTIIGCTVVTKRFSNFSLLGTIGPTCLYSCQIAIKKIFNEKRDIHARWHKMIIKFKFFKKIFFVCSVHHSSSLRNEKLVVVSYFYCRICRVFSSITKYVSFVKLNELRENTVSSLTKFLFTMNFHIENVSWTYRVKEFSTGAIR